MTTFDDKAAIYRQIADEIEHQILDGSLAPGEQVMSTNAIVASYSVNPRTAAKAVSLLVDDGLVVKKRGIGMFVADDAHVRLVGRRRERFFEDVFDPVVEQARLLGISGEQLQARLKSST